MTQRPNLPDFRASDPGAYDRLPIILVHGWRGSKRDWEDVTGEPEPPLPETGTREAAGDHWYPPVFPLAGFQVQPVTQPPAKGLYTVLQGAGHPVVTWTQTETLGPIEDTVPELEQVVAFAGEEYEADRVVLIGHSRGGLLCRAYLRRHPDDHGVAALVTIGTPHQGSRVAKMDDKLLDLACSGVGALLPVPAGTLLVKTVVALIRRLFISELGSLDELERWAAASDYLLDLIPESQLETVRYIAIAGMQPTMSHVAIQYYDLMSYIPQGFARPWHWTRVIWKKPLPEVLSEPDPPIVPEYREFYPGEGDGVVAVDSALLRDTADTVNVVNLEYSAGHTLLLRMSGLHQRLAHELRAIG